MSADKSYYFVTGLPRCKSAWFANYLTWGDSFCYHDAFHTQDSFEDFCRMLEGTPAKFVGHSDPANVVYWRDLHARFPEADWVVVKRPVQDAWKASIRAFGYDGGMHDAFEDLQVELRSLIKELSPLIVSFDNPHPLDIADYLGVDVGGWSRTELLKNLNVQVDPKHLTNMISNIAARPWFCSEEVA